MATQLGFYLNLDRCVQCHACEVACKARRNVEPGIAWRRVVGLWVGDYPNPIQRTITYACMHCGRPACLEVCPTQAICKRPDDGIVLVDREACIGCGACGEACPFGVPQFGRDGTMSMCDLCADRLARGARPACVVTCPTEALLFGPLEELRALASAQNGVAPQLLGGDTQPSMLVHSDRWSALEPMLPWK